MKVAEVRYAGRGRVAHRTGPSGTPYGFHSTPSGHESDWKAVTEVEDAEYFDSQRHFEVDWTARGELLRHGENAVEALKEVGYSTKQKLVGDDGFDLDVAGNASEDEMEEALREHVKELHEQEEL